MWEIDFFFAPAPVYEGGERPFYPYTILLVDGNLGLPLNAGVAKPQEYTDRFSEILMEFMERSGMMPGEILVRKEEAFELLDPIASRLGIKLQLVKKLKMMEQVQSFMFQFFNR